MSEIKSTIQPSSTINAEINPSSKVTSTAIGIHNINAASVGLGNVTNESKATMFTNPTFTGSVTGTLGTAAQPNITSVGTLTALSVGDLSITGTPTAPTAATGTNTTQVATTEFVQSAVQGEDTIAEMNDVTLTSLADGELLVSSSGNFINQTLAEAGINAITLTTAAQTNITSVGTLTSLTVSGDVNVATAPTTGNHLTNKTYVDAQIAGIVDSAPATLDTLNELAAALGDDENFASTTSTNIGLKLAKASNLSDLADVATARTNLELQNVTNESKATMFANPSFTGSVTGNGQLKLTGSSGLEIQQGFFNNGGIRIKHAASADNEFTIAYEGNTASGEGEKNFKLELKKGGSVLSVIKFKPDGNAFISTGNFGVGKTSPTSKLHVSGNTTLENGVDMATGSSTNYIGIGTTTKDRKVNIDGNVKILKSPENHKANKHVLQTISSDGTGTSVFLGGPTTIVHDLFKNSAVTSGFADMSNHYHTVHRINRITQQDGSASGPNPEVKNIERVQEQYYAIQGNNLRNDKAAFWSWHRVTRDIHVTNLSLTNLSGWNVQNDQDFGYNASSAPGGRKQTEQVAFAASQNTTFTFTSGNNPFSTVGELIRVTVTTDFVGPFVAQSHIAKITAISGDSITVVLYSGNYKSKDEAPLSTAAGTSAQTALVDNFTVDTIDSASYMTTDGNGITVSDDTNRATGFQKILDITFNASHNLVKNDTITILTDGTNGFKQAEVAHVYERPSATRVKLVYGRLFEPAANLSSLATLPQSSLVGILRGTLDGIHRYTTGDQLMTFWGNNTGRFKSYQIGPGSTADGDCIAIGHNTYNKDANTVKIGYDNNMLNIDSAGIDVAGTIESKVSGGSGILKASGAIGQLHLESDNVSLHNSTITATGGDLYYTSEGAGTDYGNHFFMTQRASDNGTKSAIMTVDGVNANVGIGTTSPDAYYALDVNGAIRAAGSGGVSSLSSLNITGGLTVDTNTLSVSAPDNKVAIGTLATGTSAKGKLTVHDTGASSTASKNRFFAISHGSNVNEYVSMYYQGTAGGSPFLISREDTGGAEMVFFNNGDINLNGGYKGITSSASTSKTPDNVGIGVNAATKLNNGSANTNGKPTNKLHIFEKQGLTMGALTAPNKDNATVRIEENSGINMYLDGNMIYSDNVLLFATDGDITLGPGKSQAAIFKTDGKVGIGSSTSPTEALDVTGNIKASGNYTGTWQGTAIADAYISSASTWNGKQDALTFGLSSGNALKSEEALTENDVLLAGASNVKGRTLSELKGDLSLNLVENTAISTFAGSSNITTVGTLTSLAVAGNIVADGTDHQLKIGGNARFQVLDGLVKALTSFSVNDTFYTFGNNELGNQTTDTTKISGDLMVDTDTLKVDVANDRVGINVASPTEALEVAGNILSVKAASGDNLILEQTANASGQEIGILFKDHLTEARSMNPSGTSATGAAARIHALRTGPSAKNYDLVFGIGSSINNSGADATFLEKMRLTGHDGDTDVYTSLKVTGGIQSTVTAAGAHSFIGDGTIKSTSYEAADFPTTSTVRTTAAFKEDGTMVQDEKVIVKKVTGTQAKAMTTNSSTYIELIPAPGANKVIVVRELEIFIDRGFWTPISGGQVRGWGNNLLIVIETPAKTNAGVGSAGFDYNTYATLQKKYLNHTINNVFVSANAVDTIIVRDAPVAQTRAYPNKPLLLKPQAANTYADLFTYSQTVDDDYYFRITYKIMDMTTDFAVTTT